MLLKAKEKTALLTLAGPEADCEFMAWSRPHAIPCQIYQSPFLVEKRKTDGTVLFRCPKAGCGYQQVPGLAAVAADSLKQKAPSAKRKILVRRVGAGTVGAGGKKKLVRVVHRQK